MRPSTSLLTSAAAFVAAFLLVLLGLAPSAVAAPTIEVVPAALTDATAGVAYSESVSASGGTAPYSFALTGGATPPGLFLDATGVLSGTPRGVGTFNFTVTATDSDPEGPYTGSRSYAVTVAAPIISVSPSTLPSATAGAAYSQSLSASGGTAPYSFAVTAGALPAGLSLSSGGAVSGTPTSAGTFNFTIRATDSTTGDGAPYAGSRAYSVTVAAPTISVSPSTVAPGTVGVAYAQTLSASGGTAPYTFATTSGTPPPGLTLTSEGTLAGTPTASGTFIFTATATDSSTGDGAPFSGSRAYAVTIAAPTVTLAPSTLPGATTGTAYSQTFSAAGGTAPYSYAVTAGALPTGLTLNAGGVLSGTPTAGGTFNFTVTTTDSSGGSGPYTGARAYALSVASPTVIVAPTTLPNATVGVAYSQTVSASGGTAPYTFAVTAGALPPGLTLSDTGVLSGTPTGSGTYNLTITSTDSSTGSGPFTGARAYALTVSAPTLALGPATLPGATTGTAYSELLTASGGTAPYSYAVTAGALPAGLSLAAGGLLSGTPTAGGSFSFTVTATDSSSGTGPFTVDRAYVLAVAATAPTAPALTSSGSGTAVQSVTVAVPEDGTVELTGTGGTPGGSPTQQTVGGQGVYQLDPGTGVLTFRPALGFSGTATPVDYRVTDAFSQSATSTYTPTVSKPAPPVARPLTSSGAGTQSATVAVPVGGTAALVAGGQQNNTEVVTADGRFVLARAAATITFTPRDGFSGVAAAVVYRVVDAYGQTADSTYQPTVTTAVPARARLDVARVVRVGPDGAGVVTSACSVSGGTLAGCRVRLLARVGDQREVVGGGETTPGHPDRLRVRLNATGRALAVRSTGVQVSARLTARTSTGAVLHDVVNLRVVSRPFALVAPVRFAGDSAVLDRANLVRLERLARRSGEVRTVTCVGRADDRQLARERAEAVCAGLDLDGVTPRIRVQVGEGRATPPSTVVLRY